ncbi:MAG: hypothetical protein VXY99_14670, partial [Pseudomonadota bacterium]|nr:hypothetical protein [Pseudomonadota bacterium]
MELIRTLTSTLVATLLCFTSIGVDAKVLSCEATKGNGRGWIPREFRIDLADDRKTAQVISPTTEIFGAKPFEKSFLGSSLWSRGKGKSKTGTHYNYQLKLDLDSNDTKAKIVTKQQGYRDIEVGFRCSVDSSNRVASGQTVVPRSQDYTSSVGLLQLGKMSKDALCKYASGEWRGAQFTAQDAIRYARDSDVDCKPSLDQGSAAKTPTYRRPQSSETLQALSAKDLCEKAISSETMQWSERPEKSEYVLEAKRRGYSCGVLSERPTWDICMSAYLLQSREDKLQEAEMIWNEIVRRGVVSSCEVSYGHDYSALKKHLSRFEAEKEARKPKSHLSFDDKSVLRIINYVLNGSEGVGIIGYTSAELRERRRSR